MDSEVFIIPCNNYCNLLLCETYDFKRENTRFVLMMSAHIIILRSTLNGISKNVINVN